jgi:hypothetical protein
MTRIAQIKMLTRGAGRADWVGKARAATYHIPLDHAVSGGKEEIRGDVRNDA